MGERAFDAVLMCAGARAAEHLPLWPGWSQVTSEAAVVVWLSSPCDAELALRLVQAGAQEVIGGASDGTEPDAVVARAVRFAVERKRIERAARKAYATDLRTGLPNHQQLIEHMSQLLALRGREPAPMALLVLRIEGFATVEAALGPESANVLRRKVAVRLRAAVRASDVVAALAADTFALLLASTDEPLDAEHVAGKLLAALHEPFQMSGQQVGVAASAGVSHFPADGTDADVLDAPGRRGRCGGAGCRTGRLRQLARERVARDRCRERRRHRARLMAAALVPLLGECRGKLLRGR